MSKLHLTSLTSDFSTSRAPSRSLTLSYKYKFNMVVRGFFEKFDSTFSGHAKKLR